MTESGRVLVTHHYLDAHRIQGAWTARQLDALGLGWPPTKHWQSRVVGTWITWQQAEQFEAGDTINARLRRLHARRMDQPTLWRRTHD
jgi:hypothetical protein